VQQGSVAQADGQGQDYLQLIPSPPGPTWDPTQIVLGFLTATASFADHYAIARQYLLPQIQSSWNPGIAVTVVAAPLTVKTTSRPQQQPPAGGTTVAVRVRVSGQQVASLTANGQYLSTQGKTQFTPRTFDLVNVNGKWRISNPPSPLLLDEPDFQRVYQPRNLYFPAVSGQALVPDPVFVPLQATSVDVAGRLVNSLQSNPQGWLSGAAQTAFPAGTRLLGKVTINAGTATVDLGGAAATARKAVLGQMMAQLLWTLAGPSSGQSAIQSVELETDGHPRQSATWSGGQPQTGQPGLIVPQEPAKAPLYASGSHGVVQLLAGPSPSATLSATPVPGQAGDMRVPFGPIAVSPDKGYVAGITRSGSAVYYGAIGRGAKLAKWSRGGGFTSISWDTHDDLWVAGSDGVWVLGPAGSSSPLGGLPHGSVISQLRFAPDGVRVAMIVHSSTGAQLLLGAIERVAGGGVALGSPTVSIGTDVLDPTQLTWYDANNLIVLSASSTGPLLQEVPVNGGSSIPIVTDPDTLSISAAGPANPLVAGVTRGRLALTSNINGTWGPEENAGLHPTYPG
jgi:hypothetical protein